jgi:syntaxin 16
MKEIIEKNKLIKERDQELEHILKSIVELNDMFKECNNFVIQQGTILNRIDYNIENTFEYVAEAKENLIITENAQNSSNYFFCIIVILIVVVFFIIIFFFRIFIF